MSDLLSVKRFDFKPDWTIGKLFVKDIIDGYTVEDEIREVKVHGETAIPYGRYLLSTRMSPKFSDTFVYSKSLNVLIDPKDKSLHPNTSDWISHEMIWITNVPDFEYVLLHWGNTDLDTEGCLVVGSHMGIIKEREGVTGSRDYYKSLYPKVYQLIKSDNQYINYTKL